MDIVNIVDAMDGVDFVDKNGRDGPAFAVPDYGLAGMKDYWTKGLQDNVDPATNLKHVTLKRKVSFF